MVTKTITIEDETFLKINEMILNNEPLKFSQVANLMIKRGFAYTAILENAKQTDEKV